MTPDGRGGGQAPRVLVVEDEANQREMLGHLLARAGYAVEAAEGGEAALALLARASFDVVLTDQRMGGLDGLRLLDRIRAASPELPVVLMTAYGSVSTAVDAMKRGAADYLTKPFERDELLLVLERVLHKQRLEAEVASLRGALHDRYRLGSIIGKSAAMQEVFALIERISRTDVPVLVRGESGTGKELVARALHQASARADGPFVGLNCAAVPESLLESEFFGHERGAFTGAVRAHPGKFEQASGGTLFLDEIGAMRFDLQAKLLRAIQEREVSRVGATATTPVDVRIVAATGEDLEEEIKRKTFRQDLFYRLSVVPIVLPPLRERREDIPLLVEHHLAESARRFGRPRVGIAPEVIDRLVLFPWPGNVRELQNCIERMVLLAEGERITLGDLPPLVRDGQAPGGGSSRFALPPDGVALGDLERDLIAQALERSNGSLGPAARLLGISYKTLQYRIQKHGLGRADVAEGAPWAASAAVGGAAGDGREECREPGEGGEDGVRPGRTS